MTKTQEKPIQIFHKGDRVAVLSPYAAAGPYDYQVGDEDLYQGDVVRVPLGRREVTGVVWGPGLSSLPPEKIKPVLAKLEAVPLSPDFVAFLDFVAAYTLSDRGAVLRLAFPVDPADDPPAPSKRGKPIGGDAPNPDHMTVNLTAQQQDAALQLVDAVTAQSFKTIVLDGVTGAGKTEVFFEAVAQALRLGRQVLILHPEIALTTAFVDRFVKRFGQAPALWHSGLTPAQRRKTWHGIVNGTIRVVAGARSALMLPYPMLSLVVVDEEHDAAYKQEDGVMYHARDMAVARGKHMGFPVVLASATPSLETMVNVWSKKYETLVLPDRFGAAALPDIRLIDLRDDKPERGQFIAPTLAKAMAETLARGEQALLFLNRRGYAPLTLCRGCGYRLMCPRCTAWMVEHRRTGRLHCHHCGYDLVLPKACPSCGTEDSFVACGPGVERIDEEVKDRFPQARTLVLSSDLYDDPARLQAAFDQITSRAVDVIIGTQIIAKGHHFPSLTLVGVIDADLGMSGGDLRAAERTFQLLQQVAGRAGRADKPGTVYLQTYMPDNKVMMALRDAARDPFLDVEAAERQQADMPPFSRLVAVLVTGANEYQAKQVAQEIARAAPRDIADFRVWGPAEAPIFRVRGKYRFRLLVQAGRTLPVQKIVAEWFDRVIIPSSVTVRVDVDPQSFL